MESVVVNIIVEMSTKVLFSSSGTSEVLDTCVSTESVIKEGVFKPPTPGGLCVTETGITLIYLYCFIIKT